MHDPIEQYLKSVVVASCLNCNKYNKVSVPKNPVECPECTHVLYYQRIVPNTKQAQTNEE